MVRERPEKIQEQLAKYANFRKKLKGVCAMYRIKEYCGGSLSVANYE